MVNAHCGLVMGAGIDARVDAHGGLVMDAEIDARVDAHGGIGIGLARVDAERVVAIIAGHAARLVYGRNKALITRQDLPPGSSAG